MKRIFVIYTDEHEIAHNVGPLNDLNLLLSQFNKKSQTGKIKVDLLN